jgi:hypothetical protein
LFTPESYRNTTTDTHLEIATELPQGNLILPMNADTNYILTKRPISEEDVYTFQTLPGLLVHKEKESHLAPGGFRLYQNYPNPFNPLTTISFYLPENENISLSIFNILGQKITTLADGNYKRGLHRLKFDGSLYASGLYFYVLQYKNSAISHKMILLK